MIIKGPILIPQIPDMTGDILDEETISSFNHRPKRCAHRRTAHTPKRRKNT